GDRAGGAVAELRQAACRGAHPQHGPRVEGPRRAGVSAPSRRAGIDVGGTKCLGVVLDPDGAILAEQRVPTPQGRPEQLIGALVELAGALGAWDTLGIGVPGLVRRDGVLVAAPNLTAVADLAVGPILAETLGRPV